MNSMLKYIFRDKVEKLDDETYAFDANRLLKKQDRDSETQYLHLEEEKRLSRYVLFSFNNNFKCLFYPVRHTILMTRNYVQVFVEFRGREPSPEPLLRHNGLLASSASA